MIDTLLNRFIFSLLCLVALPAIAADTAQPVSSRLQSVEVLPLVAGIGVARTLTVSGTWPNGCTPTSAALENAPSESIRAVFVRIVALAESGQFCAPVFTAYKLVVPYTPSAIGVDRAVVLLNSVSTSGPLLASLEARVVVASARAEHSADDISGLWYDSTTAGSGLTLNHSFAGSDALLGTWYLYDQQGIARWLTLQESVWKTDAIVEGKLFETRANACATGAAACPVAVTTPAKQVGSFRMTFSDLRAGVKPTGLVRVAPTALVEALSLSGEVVFTSRIAQFPI